MSSTKRLILKVLLVSVLVLLIQFQGLAEEEKSYSRVKSLSFGSGDYRTELYVLGNPQDEKRLNLMVQSCIHGDEHAGWVANHILIDAYEEGRLQLSGLNLYIIPELNRPACGADIRNFYPGADPTKGIYLRNNDQINMAKAWPAAFDENTKTYVGSYQGRDYPRVDADSSHLWHPPEVVEASVEIAKFVRKDVIPLIDGSNNYSLPRMDAVFCLHSVTYNLSKYAGINLEGDVSGRLFPEAVRTFSEEEIIGSGHALPGGDCNFANSALGIYGVIIDVATNKGITDGAMKFKPLEEQSRDTLR